METRILAQQIDDTIIFTYSSDNSGYASPETRRMRAVPRPWTRPWNPCYPPYGYVIPPRLRSPERSNARRLVEGEAASYSYEALEQQPEWQNLQHGENQNRRDGSLLSEEYLTRSLDCPRTAEEICIICQDGIQQEEEISTLRCSHVYHLRCIRKWLMIKNECAVCRTSVIRE